MRKIYLPHIERITDALEIDDISEIIRLTKKEQALKCGQNKKEDVQNPFKTL